MMRVTKTKTGILIVGTGAGILLTTKLIKKLKNSK